MSNRPDNSAFKQQKLPAWQPVLTPQWVIGGFATTGILMVIIGVIVLVTSSQTITVEQNYSSVCGSQVTCQVNVTIEKAMTAPVYFYFKLTNYYQNHRRYVKSKSNDQLQGKSNPDITGCDPLETSFGKTLYPCGLVAGSFFTDQFNASVAGASVDWTSNGIAWPSDLAKLYIARNITSSETNVVEQLDTNVTLPAVNDEEFVVWMRTSGLPTFKKLNRIINQDLNAGDVVTFNIANNYVVSDFGGTKSLVLSTTNWLGAKNDFLGYAYVGTGLLCLVLAAIFLLKHMSSPRTIGDLDYFKGDGKAVEATEIKH